MSNLIHSIDSSSSTKKTSATSLIIIIVVTALLGTGTGYMLNSMKTGGTNPTDTGSTTKETVKETAGILDKKTFPDNAEGMLRDGGIGDEGSHHLERSGGVSQNVYLTSTTVDLSEFVGKKTRVWGKTFQGDKAGWLMDVGYVEVLQ